MGVGESWITQIARVVHGATELSRFGCVQSVYEAGIRREDPYCTIAGYVASEEEWDWFEHDWRHVLWAFMRDIPEDERFFHALEFYGDGYKFKNWKTGKRDSFITSLFDVVNGYNLFLFSSTVESRLFFRLTTDERRYLTGGFHDGTKWRKPTGSPNTPYYIPFHNCIIQSAQFVPIGEKVFPIMSRQDQYQTHALELYDRVLNSYPRIQCRSLLGDDMVFSDPKRVPALQAADLAAYWLGQMMKYRAKHSNQRWEEYPHVEETRRVVANLRALSDMKLFNCEGLMLVLQGCNRYIKTSFPTLDQALPSLPVELRKKVLSVMWKADLRRFLDLWHPNAQACHDETQPVPFDQSEPPLRRWIKRLSQPTT